MRFRLLKYMCRVWDDSFKEHPDQAELRPIVPLVFYQEESRWRYSTEFADLFAKDAQGYDFLPRFAHYLIDQSDLAVDQTQGGLKAQVAQLLLMATYQKIYARGVGIRRPSLRHSRSSWDKQPRHRPKLLSRLSTKFL